ncbi:MAG: hydroxyphenylacetyl-CoA thioesterase PaaI [Pseudomonadota bacterium]
MDKASTPTDQKAALKLASAVSTAMYGHDRATQAMGMELEQVGPGHARMNMTVRPDMLNGHQICHGGYLFALADSAFAYACNSYNYKTVGVACSIDFLAPGRLGDVLSAEATEQSQLGKNGIYDVKIRNQRGQTLALFRGKSLRIAGEVYPLDQPI